MLGARAWMINRAQCTLLDVLIPEGESWAEEQLCPVRMVVVREQT